jgi:hypothetical protein
VREGRESSRVDLYAVLSSDPLALPKRRCRQPDHVLQSRKSPKHRSPPSTLAGYACTPLLFLFPKALDVTHDQDRDGQRSDGSTSISNSLSRLSSPGAKLVPVCQVVCWWLLTASPRTALFRRHRHAAAAYSHSITGGGALGLPQPLSIRKRKRKPCPEPCPEPSPSISMLPFDPALVALYVPCTH